MTAAPGNLPNRYLVAISQAEAALMKTSFSGSAIAARAASDNAWSPARHHRNAWGVEQQTHGLEARGTLLPAFHLFRRQRLEKLGSHRQLSFSAPKTRLAFGAIGTSLATGFRPRAMMISSPASARAIRRDR